jgi:thiamine kinase-like enzyme
MPLRIAEAYQALAEAQGVAIPPEYELADAIARRVELALIVSPVRLRPCHNDLLPGNLIDDGARMRIVDWEYAGMGDRYFDLGNLAVNNGLGPEQEALLLESYFGAEASAVRLETLRLMRFMSDFREAMWGVLQGTLSDLDFDFDEYAAKHFERLGAAEADPRFEVLLEEAGRAAG